MRITLNDVIEKSKINDFAWLAKSKTRIKLIIKGSKLSEDVIEYLWHEVTLRRFIVINQKISNYILEDVFAQTLTNKKKFVSSAVYKETLVNQDIPDEKIKDVWNHFNDKYYPEPLVIMIKTIPQKSLNVLGINSLLTLIEPGRLQIDDIISCCVAIIEIEPKYFSKIYQKFFGLKDVGWIYHSMSVFSKITYFSDDLVNELYEEVDEMSFYPILQTLMSRSNCSYSIQAKFLLNK